MIEINGEQITNEEAMGLIRMLYHDAKQLAGQFYDADRSVKFRTNWPDQYKFANSEWKSFIEATRTAYALQLGDPKTKPEDARRMHLALVLEAKIGEGKEKDNRLQLFPNTQQFVGDKHENKKILEKFGAVPNYRAALLNSTATRH